MFCLTTLLLSQNLNSRAVSSEHRESYVAFEIVLAEIINLFQLEQGAAKSPSVVALAPQSITADSLVGASQTTPSSVSAVVTPSTSSQVSAATVQAVSESIQKTPTIEEQYESAYVKVKSDWKSQITGYDLKDRYKVFFDMSDFVHSDDISDSAVSLSSGMLTPSAVQALQWRFAKENAGSINFLNHPEELSPITDLVTVNPNNTVSLNASVLKTKLIDPSVRYLQQAGKDVYARVVQIGPPSNKKYIVVAVQQHGEILVVDPSTQTKAYAANFVSALVNGFNTQKDATHPVTYRSNANNFVYGGIEGSEPGSTADGIFSFAYWAAIMSANSLDGYQALNGFQSERDSKLEDFDTLAVGAVYSKKVARVPSTSSSADFEANVRAWLRTELDNL